MSRVWIFLFAALALASCPLKAQTTSTVQELTFQISTSSSWTDTGLDLQAGDLVKISATAAGAGDESSGAQACNPAGLSSSTASENLPLPGANPGALIARLHAHGAAPILVGTGREVRVDEPSHLFLGMNGSSAPPCRRSLTVQVQKIPGGSAAANSATTQQTPRGEQLKSQLGTAAQVFLSGQFGLGKSESEAVNVSSSSNSSAAEAASAPLLSVSSQQLDAGLRSNIDNLPRRVNDQFNNLGDMVNFVIVGSEKDVQAALDAANWHVADSDSKKAVLNALMETYESKDYLTMPMSTLYLFGRKQDFGYEMAEPIAMVASRHHFRIWKAPFAWQGSDVWVGAGTHDIGFAKDKRNNNVTHKIDPAVDGERDNIGGSLQKANKAKMLMYYLPPNPVQDAKNATGDGYHSDGRLLVIFLQ